jgi:hypothetical protein
MTLQIIWFAMLAGVTAFAAVTVLVLTRQPIAEPVISYMAVGAGALAIVASNIVPSLIGRQLAAKVLSEVDSDSPGEQLAERLGAAYQTKLIVGLAILEGAAFFTLVAYQIERQQFALAATVGLWFLLLIRLPTQTRVDDWCRGVYENEAMYHL